MTIPLHLCWFSCDSLFFSLPFFLCLPSTSLFLSIFQRKSRFASSHLTRVRQQPHQDLKEQSFPLRRKEDIEKKGRRGHGIKSFWGTTTKKRWTNFWFPLLFYQFLFVSFLLWVNSRFLSSFSLSLRCLIPFLPRLYFFDCIFTVSSIHSHFSFHAFPSFPSNKSNMSNGKKKTVRNENEWYDGMTFVSFVVEGKWEWNESFSHLSLPQVKHQEEKNGSKASKNHHRIILKSNQRQVSQSCFIISCESSCLKRIFLSLVMELRETWLLAASDMILKKECLEDDDNLILWIESIRSNCLFNATLLHLLMVHNNSRLIYSLIFYTNFVDTSIIVLLDLEILKKSARKQSNTIRMRLSWQVIHFVIQREKKERLVWNMSQ